MSMLVRAAGSDAVENDHGSIFGRHVPAPSNCGRHESLVHDHPFGLPRRLIAEQQHR